MPRTTEASAAEGQIMQQRQKNLEGKGHVMKEQSKLLM
jgi:hypothetical protein